MAESKQRRTGTGVLIILGALFLFAAGTAGAQELTIPYTFSSGNVISSFEMNENFAALAEKTNALDSVIGSLNETGSFWTYNAGILTYTSGNVGIGTDSPANLFTVEKDDGTSDGAHLLASFTRGGLSGNNAGVSFGYYGAGDDDAGGYIRAEDGVPLVFGSPIYAEGGGPLRISSGSDASSSGGGYFQIGDSSGLNIGLDTNEIQSRNNGAISKLILQDEGGLLKVHGAVNGTEFVVTDSGDVGIGTTNPSEKLHIEDGDIALIGDIHPSISFEDDTGKFFQLALGDNKLTIREDTTSGDDIVFCVYNHAVGVGGILNPNVALDVSGSIEYTGSITHVSDIRLKENIAPIGCALDKIGSIDGISYNLRGNDQREYGVSAQQLQGVVPEVVSVIDESKRYPRCQLCRARSRPHRSGKGTETGKRRSPRAD